MTTVTTPIDGRKIFISQTWEQTSREAVLGLGFQHLMDVSGGDLGPTDAEYAEAAGKAGEAFSWRDVKCFAHADVAPGPSGLGWGMYVRGEDLPDDRVSLCAYLIWRHRGVTPEAALEQAKAIYAARDAEDEAASAAYVAAKDDEERRLALTPLTEAEHAYWDAVAAEAEAHAASSDRD